MLRITLTSGSMMNRLRLFRDVLRGMEAILQPRTGNYQVLPLLNNVVASEF